MTYFRNKNSCKKNEAIYKTDSFIAQPWLEPRVSIKEKEYLCVKQYCFLLPDQSGTDSFS